MRRLAEAMAAAKAAGGPGNTLKRLGLVIAASATFVRLYLLPSKPNALPDDVRLVPTW
jgi:magnesium-protoporphyrin IX monomethyl ester (oxidative) cyclase